VCFVTTINSDAGNWESEAGSAPLSQDLIHEMALLPHLWLSRVEMEILVKIKNMR